MLRCAGSSVLYLWMCLYITAHDHIAVATCLMLLCILCGAHRWIELRAFGLRCDGLKVDVDDKWTLWYGSRRHARLYPPPKSQISSLYAQSCGNHVCEPLVGLHLSSHWDSARRSAYALNVCSGHIGCDWDPSPWCSWTSLPSQSGAGWFWTCNQAACWDCGHWLPCLKQRCGWLAHFYFSTFGIREIIRSIVASSPSKLNPPGWDIWRVCLHCDRQFKQC